MDIEPIYCAEQIVVPADLADVLKAYTKEVIRRQPDDLLEFSAIYFANLANVSGGIESLVPPTIEQMKDLRDRLASDEAAEPAKVLRFCQELGIYQQTAQRAIETGSYKPGASVDVQVLLLLLTSMGSESLSEILAGIFQVLGSNNSMPTPLFLKLFRYMSSLDPDISTTDVEAAANEVIGTPTVSLSQVYELPVVKSRLPTI